MPEINTKSVLLDLVAKNYTGDSHGYEKFLRSDAPLSTHVAKAPEPIFAPIIPVIASVESPVIPVATPEVLAAPVMTQELDDPKRKVSLEEQKAIRQ
jgi:hypothetical protein